MAIEDFIDSAQCGLASIVLDADNPIPLHNGSVGRKDRAPKLLEDGLQPITHLSGTCRLAGELFALAPLVGKQGGSLGLRSTLALSLTGWRRQRGRLRHGVDDLRLIARPLLQHRLNGLDPRL